MEAADWVELRFGCGGGGGLVGSLVVGCIPRYVLIGFYLITICADDDEELAGG